MNMQKWIKTIISNMMIVSFVGCGGSTSISVLPSIDSFQQAGSKITAKMDILWVIDNSGSMIEEQKKLKENFKSFITSFVGKGYDYRMAVITTDAWVTYKFSDTPNFILKNRPDNYVNYDDYTVTEQISSACDGNLNEETNIQPKDPTEFKQAAPILSSKFLDGNVNFGEIVDGVTTVGAPTGKPIISSADDILAGGDIDFSLKTVDEGDADPSDDIETIFGANLLQGVCGYGFESGLRSVKVALENPANAGFPRSDAHLAVIIITDEEDNIDRRTPDTNSDYSIENMDSFLTGLSSERHGYSFHSIAILSGDTACLESSSNVFPASHGTRYEALSDASGGLKISLCSDFSVTLQDIAQTIIENTIEFSLTNTPADPNLLHVSIKNPSDSSFSAVPQNGDNGWTYNVSANSIVFHGTGVPFQGAQIQILYDPDGL